MDPDNDHLLAHAQASTKEIELRSVVGAEETADAGENNRRPTSKGWKKLKSSYSTASRFRTTSHDKLGEDLRFASDSCQNRLACTLQLGIHKSVASESKMAATGVISTGKIPIEFGDNHGTFESWEPGMFSSVRKDLNIDAIEYQAVLEKTDADKTTHSTLRFIGSHDASGKSLVCPWFLFTPDMRYCIKTLHPVEAKLLLELASSYAHHCHSNNKTMLPHFLGLYSVTLESSIVFGPSVVWFVVQRNVFASTCHISEKYDLKGSRAGRRASRREVAKGNACIYKDLDFMARERSFQLVDKEEYDSFKAQIKLDVDWLASHSLIDYSLLVGFVAAEEVHHTMDSRISRHAVRRLQLHSTDDQASFYYAFVGIVDIFAKYGCLKRLETLIFDPCHLRKISCQSPALYSKRFCEFLESQTHYAPAADKDDDEKDSETMKDNKSPPLKAASLDSVRP